MAASNANSILKKQKLPEWGTNIINTVLTDHNTETTAFTENCRSKWLKEFIDLADVTTIKRITKSSDTTDKLITSTIRNIQKNFKEIVWKKRNALQKTKSCNRVLIQHFTSNLQERTKDFLLKLQRGNTK